MAETTTEKPMTSDRLQKGHSPCREDESVALRVQLIPEQNRHIMKVNDLQDGTGGTGGTVNRKLCLHCGILQDQRSTCTLCCSRIEMSMYDSQMFMVAKKN